MNYKYAVGLVLVPIYVALASVYLGYHHLPHFLDLFYGAVVFAPIAVWGGAVALRTWLATALFFIAMIEFDAFGALMSPPVPIVTAVVASLQDILINAVPSALLFLAARMVRSKLFPEG